MSSYVVKLARYAKARAVDANRKRLRRVRRRFANRHRDFDPVLVAGAMGSGTSLTALMIAKHLDCAGVVTESARQIARQSFLWMDKTESYAPIRAYEAAIGIHPEWSVDEGRNRILDMYRANAIRPGQTIVDKGPNTNLSRAEYLLACFPTARFLLVFRDPASNIEGFRRKWSSFGEDTIDENIRFYRELHERFLAFCDARAIPLVVIEYERFIENPDAALTRIGEYLRLPRTTTELELEERPESGTRGIRNVRDGEIRIVDGATTDSISKLSAEEVARIRAELGPLHHEMQKRALVDHDAG